MIILLILPVFTWCLQECFEEYQNHSLIGSTIVSLDNVSLKQCHQACLEIKNQRCRSVMFVRMKLHCLINSQDKEENPNAFFRVMDTVDYYHRTCYDKPSVAVLRDSSLFQDQCYEITKGKQCIIASQSRHDIPDLFIDDEGAIYLENTCLHDERKSIDSKNVLPSGVEISGYDSFSESTSHETQMVSATKNEVPSIDPKVINLVNDHCRNSTRSIVFFLWIIVLQTIDSYNVDTPVEKSASVASYGVKLHDSRVKNCFTNNFATIQSKTSALLSICSVLTEFTDENSKEISRHLTSTGLEKKQRS
uniref:Apple domain-containing protein n=1 Tax=Heterorhabditis bacteriophora TaxID=37862 RepID=A0A1I7XM37_HETBA